MPDSLTSRTHTIPQLIKLFKVHRVTIYDWFDLWELGGIEALHKKPGQGRRPKLSPANPQHVERARALVENERQNLKAVVAQLSNELNITMHPDTGNSSFPVSFRAASGFNTGLKKQ